MSKYIATILGDAAPEQSLIYALEGVGFSVVHVTQQVNLTASSAVIFCRRLEDISLVPDAYPRVVIITEDGDPTQDGLDAQPVENAKARGWLLLGPAALRTWVAAGRISRLAESAALGSVLGASAEFSTIHQADVPWVKRHWDMVAWSFRSPVASIAMRGRRHPLTDEWAETDTQLVLESGLGLSALWSQIRRPERDVSRFVFEHGTVEFAHDAPNAELSVHHLETPDVLALDEALRCPADTIVAESLLAAAGSPKNWCFSDALEVYAQASLTHGTPMSINHAPDVFVHPTVSIDGEVNIGAGTKIWHFSKLLGPLTIGERCSLGQNVVVERGVTLGDNVKIQNNVSVYSGVILEDDVFCGPSMVFTNVGTPRSHVSRKGEYDVTQVCKGASIGANATIVCGHTLGRYAFVGAGAVVTRDVPDYALVYGNPARVRGWSCQCGATLPLGIDDASEEAVCPDCGRRYHRQGYVVSQVDAG